MSNGQAKVPLIPWPKASSRATRAVVVANLAVAQPASSRDYSEEHAGRCVEPLLGAGGAIRGSGPRAFWLRHCKPPDLGCASFASQPLKLRDRQITYCPSGKSRGRRTLQVPFAAWFHDPGTRTIRNYSVGPDDGGLLAKLHLAAMADRGRELLDEWWINAHNVAESTGLGGKSLTAGIMTGSSSYSSRDCPRDYLISRIALASLYRQLSSAERHLLSANAAALPVIRCCQSRHPVWATSLAL
ncbi:hypothetical protein M441DRAFT_24528 [Trichoderma asperellum CBS 433.97]|uniref:Uncharacterized protein n=1 Tax=Trichoderma asperellum (strain ATCC 204424 / CBS 433.97 / NBRC 101777) TaxID=1042311 RepID=A0A2T3ZHR4_TRIA4|nr:hypothetical protein M441DRAFT_24528 [Trichoderma asperellum CBS 433.97]PTB44341.1 hypothetical protein M441DRAFT_24528 [Trichoderma asperellum CBS 433.97]